MPSCVEPLAGQLVVELDDPQHRGERQDRGRAPAAAGPGRRAQRGPCVTTLPTSGIDRVRSRLRSRAAGCVHYHRRGEHRRPPRRSDANARRATPDTERPTPRRPTPRRGSPRILADRRRLLPGVRAESERWRTADEQLAALAAAVEALRTHSTTPAELREALVLPFAAGPRGGGRGRPAAAGAGGPAGPRHREHRGQRAGPGRQVDAAAVGLRAGRRPDPHRAGAAGHRRAQPDLPHPGPAPRHAAAALVRHVRRRRRSRPTTRSWTSRGCRRPRTSSGTGPTPSLRNRQARRLPAQAAVAPRGFA